MPNDDVRDALKQPNGEALVRQAVETAREWKPGGTTKSADLTTMKEVTEARLAERRKGPVPMIATGIPRLDRVLGGGFEMSTLATVAALSSHGKTAFALQSCHFIATQLREKVGFISIEMTFPQLADRTFAHISDAPKQNWHMLIERLEEDAKRHFTGAADFYVAGGIITLDEVESAVRSMFEKGAKLVAIDYAQKISTGSRDDQFASMGRVSATLAALAQEYNGIVLCLAQLNKRVANRENLIPQMHDIHFGTNLTNDSDYVLFNVWPYKVDKKNQINDYLILVGKNRNGDSDVGIKCDFNAPRQRIVEADEFTDEEQERMSEFDVFNEGIQ